ncbi:hypothetical protein [Spiroplasma endosymbiont of Nebria brevicollis]|uniref:hypothetical protein n=1 Tax=Spiroplasma endosymbiont of Nebria brevicollis TaxID=3066284 RepID=UPI00313D8B84
MQKDELDNKIIDMVSNLKLFKESLFRKFIEKIKSTIKKFISKKPNNNLNENQLNIEIELKVLKSEFNPEHKLIPKTLLILAKSLTNTLKWECKC